MNRYKLILLLIFGQVFLLPLLLNIAVRFNLFTLPYFYTGIFTILAIFFTMAVMSYLILKNTDIIKIM